MFVWLTKPFSSFETVPVYVCLVDEALLVLSGSIVERFLFLSLLQVINGLMSMAFCPHVAFQAPQHFRSSETQASCDSCVVRQSVCLVSFHDHGMSSTVHVQESSYSVLLYTYRSLRRWMSNRLTCPLSCRTRVIASISTINLKVELL